MCWNARISSFLPGLALRFEPWKIFFAENEVILHIPFQDLEIVLLRESLVLSSGFEKHSQFSLDRISEPNVIQ